MLGPISLTAGELAQLITSIATLIGVLRVTRKVDIIHTATNSMKDELVASTAKASELEGHAKGLAKGLAEVKIIKKAKGKVKRG